MNSISSPWRPLVALALVIWALRASVGSATDPDAFIATCKTNTANTTALCSIDSSIVIQAPLSGRAPASLPQQVFLTGAQNASTTAGLDFNASTSPLFAIPPHGSLTISGLSLSGAALPNGPFPLPPTAFLSLLAVSAHPTANITLVNANITTPSCTSLALQQATACALSPSPNFTVTATSLLVHSYATPSLSATNVTLTCARPTSARPTPPPCLARTVTTSQQLLDALTEQLLPPAASTIGEVPLNLFLPNDISLAGIPTPYAPDPPYNNYNTYYPSALPSSLTQSRIVIAGGSIPTPPTLLSNSVAAPSGSATSTLQQPSTRLPELDLAHVPSIFQLDDTYNRVVLRSLTLTNLPYGPVGVMPDSLITAMVWSVWMRQRFALGWTQGGRLTVQDCVLRVPGEELAMWAEQMDYDQRVLEHIRATGGRMGRNTNTNSSRRSSGGAGGAPWNSAGLAGSGSQGDGDALLGGPLCAQMISNVELKNVSWVGLVWRRWVPSLHAPRPTMHQAHPSATVQDVGQCSQRRPDPLLHTTKPHAHTLGLQAPGAGAGWRPGLLLAEARTMGGLVQWRNVLLTDQPSSVWPRAGPGRQGMQVHGQLQDYRQHVPVPGSACSPARLAQPGAYQCEPDPGCDGGTPAHSASCGRLACLCFGDTSAVPFFSPQLASLAPLPDWLSWPPSAHPLCQLGPAGVAEMTGIRLVAASVGLIGPVLLTHHGLKHPASTLPRTWTGYKASERVVLRGPTQFCIVADDEMPAWSFAVMQVGGRAGAGGVVAAC